MQTGMQWKAQQHHNQATRDEQGMKQGWGSPMPSMSSAYLLWAMFL
jgi:hypothetical protein